MNICLSSTILCFEAPCTSENTTSTPEWGVWEVHFPLIKVGIRYPVSQVAVQTKPWGNHTLPGRDGELTDWRHPSPLRTWTHHLGFPPPEAYRKNPKTAVLCTNFAEFLVPRTEPNWFSLFEWYWFPVFPLISSLSSLFTCNDYLVVNWYFCCSL